MARRTKVFKLMPWIGGINSSVDSGVLNSQELVQADNVVFSSTGARIKREALEYLDDDIPAPDLRSSSGTTRTLKWTTSSLVNITSLNERLVAGEHITITGVSDYNVVDGTILTRTSVPQVSTVLCVADVAGSLAGKYFLLSAGDDGSDYYVWYSVSGSGTDPALANKTGIEVAIVTDDTNAAVATATNTVINALDDFNSSVSTATVTITNVLGGLTADGTAGNSGFTFTVTTKGGHTITYTGGSSLSESSTTAGAIVIARASSVIFAEDYWRWDGVENTQQLVFATDDFQLFTLDDGGRRVQVHGQEQVSTVVCGAASTLTSGDYFLISSGNDVVDYYVWFDIDDAGSSPAISGKTAIEVDVAAGDTAAQVATKLKVVLDAHADFSATVDTATVTITNAAAGITTVIADSNTGFTFATTTYGATLPLTALSTIRSEVFNERLILTMSGLNNLPIAYNPDQNAKYQLLSINAPDASIVFEHQGRLWMNDKTDRDRLHFCETFDESLWLGLGDSGAFPVGQGDGDPEGITNGYKYKGFAVIGKKAKRYRITGDSPENYFVELISEGLGNEGSLAVPVDETDVVFISRRGLHSQQATDAYGDTDSSYLSAKIKPTFNSFDSSRLKYTQGAYIPELNSVAFSIAEEGQNSQNAVWLYNVEADVPDAGRGAWYRWPDCSCTALTRRYTDSQYKLVFGTNAGRIVQAQDPNNFSDFDTDGIEFIIKTGTIYVDGDPQSMKAFKKLTMFYRPKGNFSFAVNTYIDNFSAQSFSFNQISGLDLLGETFVLGNSLLGSSATLAPFSFSMDGIGRGIILQISQPSADEQVELWGFAIEYEPADLMQETE
jgi:hypothetical protein